MKNSEMYNAIIKKRELLLEESSRDIQRYSASGKGRDSILGSGRANNKKNKKTELEVLIDNSICATSEVLTNKEIAEELNRLSIAGTDVIGSLGVIYRKDKLSSLKIDGSLVDLGDYIGNDKQTSATLKTSTINKTFNKPDKSEKNISRFSNPSLAVYKLRSKSNTIRDSKETGFIPVFTNMIPHTEMSRCSPHLNVVIVDDSEFPDERISLSKFLVGRNQFKNDGFARGLASTTFQNKNDIVFKTQENISVKRSGKVKPQNVTGMGIFLSPQALINADINRFQVGSNRVIDPFRPFMSIESFTIQDNLAGYKFLSTVKGSLNIKLYDRSRLPEISKLVGIKYLSSISLIIEFGWNHPEGGIISNNPFGQFLDAQKRRELFKITGTNMSVNDDGTVSISLSLISISTNNKSITPLESQYLKVEDLNEYLNLIKKKIKTKEKRKAYKTSLETNKVDKANLGKRVNDLISIDKLNEINFFENFEKIMHSSVDENEIDISAITDFLEKLQSILYAKDEGESKSDKIAADPGEKDAEEETEENIKSSSVEYMRHIASFMQSNDALVKQDSRIIENPNTDRSVGTELIIRRLNTIYSLDSESDFSFKANSSSSFQIGDEENNVSKYITVGKLLTGLYFMPLHNQKEHDEMQIYFHTANDYAGASHNVSIGDMFIDSKRFLNAVRKILEKTGRGTLDLEVIFQIVREILKNPDPYEIAYGITDIGSQLGGYTDPVLRSKERNRLIEDRNKKLIKIYKSGDNSPDVKSLDFIPVNLHMRTDVKTKLIDGILRKIVKIHVFDKAQEKHTESKMLLEGINNSDVNLFINTIKTTNNIKSNFRKFTNFFRKKDNKKENKSPVKEISEDSTTFKAIQNYTHLNIDKIIKSEVPTIEFGSNSAIIENISLTNNSGGLANELNLYRYVTLKSNPQDNNEQQNVDRLFINPSQISIQMLGCPFISIGQEFYVTAGTNTTLDTIYHVESLSHNISEGNFKTTVTLQAAGGAKYSSANLTKNLTSILNKANENLL